MSRIWKSLLMVAPVVLSACGGGSSGGGGNGNGSTAAPAPPVNRLAAYVGTWRTACFDGWFVSHAISNGPQADTLHVTTSTHYHPRDKTCQLPAVAIQTFTPATLVSYTGSETAKVRINGETLPAVKVDKLRMSTPAGSSTVTGPGMQVVENSDGSKSWCNSGPGGWGGFCISYRPVIDALPDSTAVFSILNGNLVWAEGQVDADGSYRPNVMTRQP